MEPDNTTTVQMIHQPPIGSTFSLRLDTAGPESQLTRSQASLHGGDGGDGGGRSGKSAATELGWHGAADAFFHQRRPVLIRGAAEERRPAR